MSTRTIPDIDRPKKGSFIKQRYLIALMATLSSVVCYIGRQNLSLAITAMVQEPQQVVVSNNSAASQLQTLIQAQAFKLTATKEVCPKPMVVGKDGQSVEEVQPPSFGPKYAWGAEKSIVFEAFFWSYVVCQVPGARLAESLGPKWILFVATSGTSVLNLLSPWASSVSLYALAAIRLLMGVSQAALYPACYVLYCRWLPPSERSCLIPFLGVGVYVGSIITSISAGYFIEQENYGWEFAFYMPGVICAAWSLVWIYIGANEPRQHGRISVEEIEHIESRIEPRLDPFHRSHQSNEISWRKLWRSQHVWAVTVASFASNWSFSIVLILLPTYLKDILFVGSLENGFINSMVYALFIVSAPIVGAVSTMMTESRPCGISRLNVRKLFEGIALFGQAGLFVALPWVGCDSAIVKGLFFAMIILYSFTNGGEVQVTTELSVDFAGTICAIGNCVGSTTGFIVPRVHSLIVRDSRNRAQWDSFFWVAASVNILGGLIFSIFGRNDMQDFSLPANQDDDDDSDASQSSNQHQQGASGEYQANSGARRSPSDQYKRKSYDSL